MAEIDVPKRLFGCSVIRKIGSGSRFDYYQANRDDEMFAMRISKSVYSESEEIQTLSSLNGLPVPKIISSGQVDSVYPGTKSTVTLLTLHGDSRLVQSNSHDRNRLSAVAQVLDVVSEAHKRGVTHGNIKLSKILVTRDDPSRISLSGFGIARRKSRIDDLYAISEFLPSTSTFSHLLKGDNNYAPLLNAMRDYIKQLLQAAAPLKRPRESPLPLLPKSVLLSGQVITPSGEILPVTANSTVLRLLELREGDGQLVRHDLSKVGGFSRVFPEGTEGGREALAVVGLLSCLPQTGAVNSSHGPICLAQLLTGRCDYGQSCVLVHSTRKETTAVKAVCIKHLATGGCTDCASGEVHLSQGNLDNWVSTGEV